MAAKDFASVLLIASVLSFVLGLTIAFWAAHVLHHRDRAARRSPRGRETHGASTPTERCPSAP
jgi:hypothetical protein